MEFEGSLESLYQELLPKQPRKLETERFEFLKVLGTGAFGAVFLVREAQSGEFYAFKSLSKTHLIEKKQVDHIKNEIFILASVDCPFVVRQLGFHQD